MFSAIVLLSAALDRGAEDRPRLIPDRTPFSHDDAAGRIEAPPAFVFDNGTQRVTEFGRRNNFESRSGVKRPVPWDISDEMGCVSGQ